jgi:hypothetical protein
VSTPNDKPITAWSAMFVGPVEDVDEFMLIIRKEAKRRGYRIQFKGNEGSWLGFPIIWVEKPKRKTGVRWLDFFLSWLSSYRSWSSQSWRKSRADTIASARLPINTSDSPKS